MEVEREECNEVDVDGTEGEREREGDVNGDVVRDVAVTEGRF